MLRAEARWLGERLRDVEPSRVLNIGSSDLDFRTRTQPWIDELVFRPLRDRGLTVFHQDLVAGPGVDLAGDLHDPGVRAALRALDPRCIICSNVLEHVIDREAFASILMELLPPGGRLLVTVPRAFPYHPDPIDTLFRPALDELAALFPGTRVLTGEIVEAGRLHDLVLENPSRALARLRGATTSLLERLRSRAPTARAGSDSSASAMNFGNWLIPWIYKPFELTCLDMRRT
jgi:hypothetical protein